MSRVTFKINGEEHSVGEEVSSDVMLLDYIRRGLDLRGTKFMCREGGCGACIVTAATGPGETPKAVNSCLVSITSCQDWDITTVEKVGNRLNYHPIQKQLAKDNGTQCGYCTPGWVMSMYSLLQGKKDLTKLEIEKSFGSNICRCTGYRPILDAFKKFAIDAPDSLLADIEDLKICEKSNKPCKKTCSESEWCFVSDKQLAEDYSIKINLKDGKVWYKVTKVSDIFEILSAEGSDSYMLVGGNTAKGPYPIDEYPRVLIDISGVEELKGYEEDQNLVIGASTTITDALDIFEKISTKTGFSYLQKLIKHIEYVAHIPVRNIGTLAGNLITKHKHRDFPSDIFLLLETVGADLTIVDSSGMRQVVSMEEFLETDMNSKVLYNIKLPPLGDDFKLVTFKIMPRSQNAKAIVNSGCLYQLNSSNQVESARLVFGGLSPSFIRATKTEEYLVGKSLFENNTLQGAISILSDELVVVEMPPEDSAAYRKQLSLGLFYKGLLILCPEDKLGARYKSGLTRLHEERKESSGTQDISTDPSIYPLTEEIPKVEALIQCAGEARYTDDLPSFSNELFAALVLSTVPRGNIETIDASEALKLDGVVAFYSAKDIPGKNSFVMVGMVLIAKDEELFCSKEVKYFNQPLGMIVAEDSQLAERAAKLVKVTYSDVQEPVIDLKVAKDDSTRTKLFFPKPNIGRGLFVRKEFESHYVMHGQYHFPMETIMCVTNPFEQGFHVYSTTQWMDAVQFAVSKALDIDASRVDVFTNRVGGSFGLKGTRMMCSVACSLAAFKLNRPVRLIQSMQSTSRSVGKRFPAAADFVVGVDRKGEIQRADFNMYQDNGYIISELLSYLNIGCYGNCYKTLWWNYKSYNTITDTASNTFARAPCNFEHVGMIETLMDQISYEMTLDPFDVRLANLGLTGGDMKNFAEELKSKANYTERKTAVDTFNSENRWKKRGLRWAFMKFAPLSPSAFDVHLKVCHADGTVFITHGGIEMGQGVNTKAVQIAAHFLNIPVDKIKIKGANTIVAQNNLLSSSSVTSQSIGMGVEACCKKLLLRLAPIRILLLNPSWEKLIKRAFQVKVDLSVRTFVNDIISPVFDVYGAALAEVEVDILTGESNIKRVDILEDAGRSVSPGIDRGQVEGAFIMGLGLWTSEKLVYDKDTGELLSNRTWTYHVPQARDIPQDFRISFKDNSYSGSVVLGAKVTGEPATCLSVSVPLALREAVVSARNDTGIPTTEWFNIDGPYTTEQLCMSANTRLEDFKFI